MTVRTKMKRLLYRLQRGYMMEQIILDWLDAGQAKLAEDKQTHLLNVLKGSVGELVSALAPAPLVQVETTPPAPDAYEALAT